ncbi:hypothetical protein [Burkholderia pseudomallei]|uniref:hypothetical protein n=1 Tax=Burkholderia pseudomallei TaxID=28450 RepID=UPI00100BFB0C|nr:hypothetical protein [Burkholderia pseudomallei]
MKVDSNATHSSFNSTAFHISEVAGSEIEMAIRGASALNTFIQFAPATSKSLDLPLHDRTYLLRGQTVKLNDLATWQSTIGIIALPTADCAAVPRVEIFVAAPWAALFSYAVVAISYLNSWTD